MTFPFTKPPTLRELGQESRQSYWAVRRLVLAGVVPVASFPDGDRVQVEWANRYVQNGLTADELARYRVAMKQERETA